jgi:predicted transcriptional regulator
LELWKTKYQTQYVICLDFDTILWHENRAAYAEGAANSHLDPYGNQKKLGLKFLAERLQERIGNKGYVFNSTGTGNPKILMVVEYEYIVKAPRVSDLIALANDLFPEYTQEGCIDLSRTAFSTTFIPWEKRYEMRDEIERLEPIKITHSAEQITFQTAEERRVVSATFTYFKNPKLPEELDRPEHCNKFREFLCVLTTMSALAKKGFAISQRILARTLGVTQQMASQYIKAAIKLGYLRVTNDSYVENKRAKTYKARGKLRRFLKTKVSSVLSEKLPTRIRKRTWHSTLMYYAVKCFRTNPEAFLKWVKSVKGHDEGDRMEQALNIYKWLFKIIGRTYRKP